MNKTINLDAKVGVSFNVKDAKQMTQMAEKLSGINKNLKGVGESREKAAKLLESKMRALSLEGQKQYESGQFDKDPKARQVFEQQMVKLKTEYYKITNQITGAYTKGLAKTNEEKAALEEINKEMGKKQVAINKNIAAMEELAKKTASFQYEREQVAKKLNIKTSDIRTVGDVDSQIAKRTRKDGDPKAGEAKNLEALLEYKRQLIQINEKNKDWESKQQKISELIESDYRDLGKIRQRRVEILDTIVKTARESGEINEEGEKVIKGLIKEEKLRDEIADAAEKTKAAQTSEEIKKNISANKNLAKSNEKVKHSFFQKITAATLYYAALRSVRRIMNSLISTIKELDKSLTEVAMVTKMNRDDAWGLIESYQKLAYEVGATTHEIARLSVYFFRQGRSAADALELTRVAATAAKVASIDVMESANYLTSAINGFGLAATQAMEVSDKFAALAASSASSYEEMAVALSKVAPSANVAGVSIDQMMGFLAKGIETTREAPENIGTAFKTIFARMTQLKDFGKTLEEGVSVNSVEEALKLAGVALRDEMGNFREMGDVLTELGYEWSNLGRNQQAYIATALAGTRQQSRLLAVMQNFDRTMELVETSTESAGATLAQHAEYAGGMEAASARLTTAWEEVILAFSNSGVIIWFINAIADALSFAAKGAKAFMITLTSLTTVLGGYLLLTKHSVIWGTLSNTVRLITITLLKKESLAMVNGKLVTLAFAKAKGLATTATMSLGAAIAATTLGLSLLIAGTVALVKWLGDTERASEKTSEKVKQLKVDLYNVNKELEDFIGLVDSFESLDQKIFKSNEELSEMESILAKINEFGGNEHDFVLAGQLDMRAIEAFLEAKEIEKQEKLGELRTTGYNVGIEHAYEDTTGFTANAEEQNAFIEFLANRITENYDELEKFEQEKIKAMISNNYDFYKDVYGDFFRSNLEGMKMSTVFDADFDQVVEQDVIEMIDSLNNVLSGQTDSIESGKIFEEFFNLSTEKRDQLKNMFKAELGNILDLGDNTIKSMIEAGFNINDIYSIAMGVESAFGDMTRRVGSYASASGMTYEEIEVAPEMISKYMELIEGISPDDGTGMLGALDDLIEYINQSGLSAEDAKTSIDALITTFTDQQAFKNGINNVKSISSAYTNVMDSFEKYQSGEITENINDLLVEYPELIDKFIDGTLTEKDVFSSLTESFEKSLTGNIENLKYQLGKLNEETDATEMEIIENQIRMLEDMLNNPDFLANNMIESMTKDIEDMFSTQISFLQDINSERKEEIDLMQRKIDMNKSMLELDRKISALEKDTSYGAQAQLRNLQEQRQASALEREKFVMDLVTDQQIARLEEERDKAIFNLRDNVEIIAKQVTGGSSGGGSNSFSADTGMTFKGKPLSVMGN